ncbi:MAG: PepSY domain-containing protein [Desulfobulbus sp.]|nr:PepSY domain-containing protein [Desulfobulbus sp.]
MKQKVFIPVLAFVIASMSSSAFAISVEENDALGIPAAKISLTKAISIAEQYAMGTASKAELEQDHDRWVFDVEVVKGPKVMDVKIDPENGKVLGTTVDKPDRDDDEEHDHKD